MAMNAFLSVNGLKGSARGQGKNKSNVFGFEMNIESNRDTETGLPDGKRRHRSLTVTKEIDLASPGLHKLHFSTGKNSVSSSASIEFWRVPPGGGQEEVYYSITMSNVRVAQIRTLMLMNKIDGNNLIPEYEEVSFIYESIMFKFQTKGQEAAQTDSASETEVNPAPDKIDELARKTVMDAASDLATRLGQTLMTAAGKAPAEGPPAAPPN